MRKIFLFVLSIFVISCNNDPVNNTVNPFIGTWEDSAMTYIETFYFTENTIISTYKSIEPPLDPVTVKGVYKYYDTVLIFRMESGLKFFADYFISGKNLTLTFSHNGNTAIYIKKN